MAPGSKAVDEILIGFTFGRHHARELMLKDLLQIPNVKQGFVKRGEQYFPSVIYRYITGYTQRIAEKWNPPAYPLR